MFSARCDGDDDTVSVELGGGLQRKDRVGACICLKTRMARMARMDSVVRGARP